VNRKRPEIKQKAWRTATPVKAAEKRPTRRAVRNLNLRANETEKDPVRVAENHNSKIKEAIFYELAYHGEP